MPGRVKHHTTHPLRAAGGMKKLIARMAAPQDDVPSFPNQGGRPTLSKTAIIWLTLVSVLVVTIFIIVATLLCRCTCSRKKREKKYHANGHRHHPSLEITDGRNDHVAWNRSFALVEPRTLEGPDADGFTLTPLARAAEPPAREHLEVLPPRPVVVEEDDQTDPLTPVPAARTNRGSSRYYSTVNAALKRVSQIGKAY